MELRFCQTGLSLDVPIDFVDVGDYSYKVPMIRPTTFFQYLADADRINVLWGEHDASILAEFWRRYREVEPDNTVFAAFQDHDLEIVADRTIPVYCHGDEGRGKRRKPVMVWNTHGAIGRGTRPFLARHGSLPTMRKRKMGVNLLGHSMGNRYLNFVLPKRLYGDDSECFFRMVQEMGREYNLLQTRGFQYRGQTWWVVVLGCLGDLVFFSKVASLTRSFTRGPKKVGQVQQGVCFLCNAGCPNVPFEDCNTNAAWTNTMGDPPWNEEPSLLQLVHHVPNLQASFFKLDVWHCLHLGLGRNFVSSVVAEILHRFPGHWACSFNPSHVLHNRLFCYKKHSS